MMSTDVLSQVLRDGGWPGPQYDHGGICPVRVPASGDGAELYLLRTWDSVVTVLRKPALRDLRNIHPGHAVGGVTLQHEHGLLRRNPPDTDIGRAFKPLFADVERWRPGIRAFARLRVGQVRVARRPVDLAAVFCRPFIGDVVTLTAGLRNGEWPILRELHRCPGMALVEMAMAEGLAALTEVNPGLRLAVRPDQVPWVEGTMPAPAEIPAVTG